MAHLQLSTGCLQAAMNSEQFAGCPVLLQVLEVQRVTPKGAPGPARIKIVVSDGMHKAMALLASQLAVHVDSGQLQVGSIVRVTELVGNRKLQQRGQVVDKRLLIILNLTVEALPQKIVGAPTNVPDGGGAPAAATAAAAPAVAAAASAVAAAAPAAAAARAAAFARWTAAPTSPADLDGKDIETLRLEGGRIAAYMELTDRIADTVYVDIAGCRVFAGDMRTAKPGQTVARALAELLGPVVYAVGRGKLREGDVALFLKQRANVDLGGGKLTLSLLNLMPSRSLAELTRLLEDWAWGDDGDDEDDGGGGDDGAGGGCGGGGGGGGGRKKRVR